MVAASLGWWTTPALAILAASIPSVQAIAQSYCSNLNTGTGSGTYAQYQSTGLCHDQCLASNNAFAILQFQYCWCSDYIPAQQLSIATCSQGCAGDDREDCGSVSNNAFGYIAVSGKTPSGTAGAGGRSQQTRLSTTPVRTAAPLTTTQSRSLTAPSTTTSSITTSPSAAVTTPSSSATDTADSTVTGTRIVTVSGAIVTQTVTSIRPQATLSGSAEATQQKSSNTGVIVGAVLGTVLGLLLIAGLIAFFWWRKRRATSGKHSQVPAALKRDASVLSRSGLMGAAAVSDKDRSMEETRYGSQRHSQLYPDTDEAARSAGSGSQDGSTPALARRNSRPLVYDQRLNPAALMQNYQLNGSRTSIGTLQDQRDYSRPLGVTNPDP